ncbi:hypothetical protein ASG35_11780 [Burkholderia sp. Leaf177]|nr:hypothetical protein ASG35_11780 [Burkholderia sp. Leaf177]
MTLFFGLVSIPVKLYSATESASGVGFNLLTPEGGRVKQQYISEATGEVVARADMKKGYEFEKGNFVVFAPEELKALEEGATHCAWWCEVRVAFLIALPVFTSSRHSFRQCYTEQFAREIPD